MTRQINDTGTQITERNEEYTIWDHAGLNFGLDSTHDSRPCNVPFGSSNTASLIKAVEHFLLAVFPLKASRPVLREALIGCGAVAHASVGKDRVDTVLVGGGVDTADAEAGHRAGQVDVGGDAQQYRVGVLYI